NYLLDFYIMLHHSPRSTLLPSTTLFRSTVATIPVPSSRSVLVACALGGESVAIASNQRTSSFCCSDSSLSITTVTNSVGKIFRGDRKSTRLNSSHVKTSYAVFCLKKKRY